MSEIRPLRYEEGVLYLLDQRKLPQEVTFIACHTVREVAAAIKEMVVRGAPAIGATTAYGMVIAARECLEETGHTASLLGGGGSYREKLEQAMDSAAQRLLATRPTAVNLAWAVRRMLSRLTADKESSPPEMVTVLESEARAIVEEDLAANKAMGHYGSKLVPKGASVLTHCNAGALATCGYGTALGVVRAAFEKDPKVQVFACETRPFLQGARLTAWELQQDGIPVTVITDNMAAYLMGQGRIDLVVVGADRIAANGDVANKIGTYGLAVLAKHHGIPFLVAAPLSTIDRETPDGTHIPIEQRDPKEVTHLAGTQITPPGVPVLNPAFDVTPAALVTAIVTEHGVLKPPYERSLAQLP